MFGQHVNPLVVWATQYALDLFVLFDAVANNACFRLQLRLMTPRRNSNSSVCVCCLLACLPVCSPAVACRSSACSPACRLPACAPAVLSGRGPWVPCAVRFLGSSLSAGLFSESYNRPAVCVSFLLTLRAIFPNKRAAGQEFFGAEVQFTQPRFELCDRRKPLAADSREGRPWRLRI